VKTTAWALFGQTTWNIDEQWAVTLGGRFSYEKKKAETLPSKLESLTLGNGFPPGTPVILPFKDSKDWDQFTPKLTIEYNLDDYMVYMTLARGFKSGGYNVPAAGNEPLDPEILDMVEFGLKGEFLDNQLRVNTSLYYYDYSDLQVTRAASGNTAVLVTENAADASIYGLDADVTWAATDNLTITAGLNWLDTEYKDFDSGAKLFNAVITGDPTAAGISNVPFDASGATMLRAPDWSGFVSATYEFQAGTGRVPVVLTYSYKDDYEYDFIVNPIMDELRQEAYSLFNARISYISGDDVWSVAAWGNNLTDEEYFDDKVAAGAGLRGAYAPPRTYGVDVTYNF
jgi:iron complex outermembrane receptor protein